MSSARPRKEAAKAATIREKEISYINASRWSNFFNAGIFASVGAISVSAIKDGLLTLLNNPVVRFAAAPVTAVSSFAEMIIEWRKALLSRESFGIARAVMVTLTGAAAIAAAVIVMGAYAAAYFVLPFLAVGYAGVRSLFDIASSLYLGVEAIRNRNDAGVSSSYSARAWSSLLNGLLYGVVAAAVGVAAFLAAPVYLLAAELAALGAAIAGGVYTLVKAGVLGRAEGIADKGEPRVNNQAHHNVCSTSAFAKVFGRDALQQRALDVQAGREDDLLAATSDASATGYVPVPVPAPNQEDSRSFGMGSSN